MPNSPCLTCTRVRDPQDCENKLCKDWQAWFIDRWESMRNSVRDQIRETPVQEIGIPLGGNRYASPHRVRQFLTQNPCEHCPSPKGQCKTPCTTKMRWDIMKKESGK